MSSCLPAVPSLGFGSLLGELDVSAFLVTLSLCLQKQGYQGFPGGSVGKESASNAGDRPWFDSWVRKIPWKRDRLPTPVFLGFPCGSAGKESACNAIDLGSIPGLG